MHKQATLKKFVQSSKTMPHWRKNILQFNHGEKNPAHARAEKNCIHKRIAQLPTPSKVHPLYISIFHFLELIKDDNYEWHSK